MTRPAFVLAPCLVLACLVGPARALLAQAPGRSSQSPKPGAAASATSRCQSPPCCGDYCDFANNPCDPSSGCTCAYMSNTCEKRFNWCSGDAQCREALDDRGARCVANACWGTGTSCQSQACRQGDGCQDDQDCAAGWTCSTGNGVCNPPQPPPDQCDQAGWTWDAHYDPPYGGCVPPASWPATMLCHPAAGSPPTCLLCDKNPWALQQNCPSDGRFASYVYPWEGQLYCCVESPEDLRPGPKRPKRSKP